MERTLEDLAKSLHRISSGLHFASLADDAGSISRNQSAIESVQECILEKEVSRYQVDDSRAFTQDEQDRGNNSQWAIDKDQDSELREVGKEEHATNNSDR